MSRISLDSVIDKTLINKFRGLASGNASSGQSIAKTLNGGGAVTIADGLRQGARTFATAVQNLNSTVSVVNVAKAVLEKLGDVTDKMILLTDRASRSGVGSAGRASIDREFRKLATTFRKTLENAKVSSKEFLTVEGLSGIFQAVGLDRETSDSIADVFSRFIIPAKDDALASEYIKGKRPVIVPASAFHGPASTVSYNIQKLSDSAVSGTAQVCTGTNVFIDNDNILNQNPGFDSIFLKSANGTLSSLRAGMLTAPFDTLAVNENSGYTLIATNQDFGANPTNEYVAYLMNSSGELVHRFDDFDPDPGGTYENVSDFQISADNATISYIQRESDAGSGLRTYKVMSQSAASFSTTGGTNTVTERDRTFYDYSMGDPVNSFDSLKMSDDASHFAYNKFNGAGGTYVTIFDAHTGARATTLDSFQFIDNDKLVFYDSSDGKIHIHPEGTSDETAVTGSLDDVQHLQAVQASDGNSGYFVVDSDVSGSRQVSLYSASDTTAAYTLSLQPTDTISSLSIAYNIAGQPEFGMLGAIPSLSNDTDTEFYRITANTRASGQRFERMSKEFSSLFALDANIRSRANAVRMNVDLKALKAQIKENLSALNTATDVVSKNLELARATGLAFLDASSTISSSSDAATVAASLREAIRANARQAISQAENLEPMIVAALSLNVTA